ncbi:putative membrane protein [Arcticibacter tournemirensis]|uniref:Bestrophin n=1 Tax=Arcticibacter tournemirensis TaxID=699437 RepID=A0A5M9GK14_9SPHI|nr:bestrophin family protein [Arcticibacter tournemirensis]KAA8474650.1 bestrophin [Arcticibacter tournemirensis]TQM46790.1 putative membrane protein [Arcticibacter tournemirensis]
MINYNPKVWFPFIFKFNKTDTLRRLFPLMCLAAVYSGVVAWLELEYFQLSKNSYVSNVGLMHSVLGFVISLLLVFRTNTAYDRWWEGRKQLGALTNSARNLAIKLHAFIKDEEDKHFFRLMIPNYAFALKNHLRENDDFHELDPVLDLKRNHHLPNQIASKIFARVIDLEQQGKLSADAIWLINEEIKSLTDICGACERIKNTPIPYTYSVFIKKFIFFYILTLPFGWVFNIGYLIIPVIVFILYAFASLELIAEEIENPFGKDDNDLPVDQICHNIRKHVSEML